MSTDFQSYKEEVAQDNLSTESLAHSKELLDKVLKELNKHVLGQEQLKEMLVTALVANGHVLLEGVPGLAKTLIIRALSKSVDGTFSRIQFTPDLLPSDIVGSEIYRPEEGQFITRKGPVFANFVLADEINRAPAKVQSALLETMQEHQATIGDKEIKTPEPFFVLATQNPLEQEGTYALPEAQIDRFLMKLIVGYPTPEVEAQMLELITNGQTKSESVTKQISLSELSFIQKNAEKVYVDERIRRYIIELVTATRDIEKYLPGHRRFIQLGASPRASISLYTVSKAYAILRDSKFVYPQIIKDIAHNILRHRIILTYEAEIERVTADDLVTELLAKVPVP